MTTLNADFIIVSGGTAGIALATRLSEDPQKHVLVLEAGNDMSADPRLTTPALWPGLLSSDADWSFMSAPQDACFGKQLPLPAGKMIGGSSGLNACAFTATSKLHLDTVAKLGNPGWDWKSMVPYYRKIYTLTLPEAERQKKLGLEYVDTAINGASGPIQVSFPDAIDDPIVAAWPSVFKNIGFPMTGDPFSESISGGFTNATVIDPVKKTRSYAGNDYYNLAKGRDNLKVVTCATVRKLIFESSLEVSLRASGVQYIVDGKDQVAHARCEVILSGGSYNSPKLLEMSGIGSRKILEKQRIEVRLENDGVGENLQDHILTGLSFEVEDYIQTKDSLMRKDPETLAQAMDDYKNRRFGPLTVAGHFSSALLPLPDFISEEGQAKREALLERTLPSTATNPFEHDMHEYLANILRDPRESTSMYFSYAAQSDFVAPGVTRTAAELIQSKDPANFITIISEPSHPLSRGSVHIASSDPAVPPTINPRWLSHELDVELLARHVRYIEHIADTEPLKQLLKPGGKRIPSSIKDLRELPLEKVKEYVRASAKSGWHMVGTCSMMPKDKGGVVDPRLRVYGVKGLRVVDASIIPIVPRGNTTSIVYAVAEKAADLIKEDWASKD